MVHDIYNEVKGFVALNPLIGVYHVGEVRATQSMSTGQPLLIVRDTLDEAIAMAFIEYNKETGEGIPRQIDWIVLDTEVEANGLSAVINTFPDVKIQPIPNGDKWLIPYADYFLDMLEDSADKEALVTSLSPYLTGIKTTAQVTA